MQIRFLLGPAGGGKTFRCLAETRAALRGSPDGRPLLFLTPKQTTYQVERQLLSDPSIPGYTRLQILSFERLAYYIFDQLKQSPPEMLDEEGRLMVLRGLLSKKRDDLKLFRASARLTGFAEQLSLVLRELQRNQLTPESLQKLAEDVHHSESLSLKLQDLATLLRDYLGWLKAHNLRDADNLLAAVRERLEPLLTEAMSSPLPPPLLFDEVWVDGFAEWSPQEMDLLTALAPRCQKLTLTFCLESVPTKKLSWLSNFSLARKTFEECRRRLDRLSNVELTTQTLPRIPDQNRFQHSPILQHLERAWEDPHPYSGPAKTPASPDPLKATLRMVSCVNPEAEATLAAREILRHVRAGGRYRDTTVLVRRLEDYHDPLQRILSRYEIPFFLDRREPIAHHPLAELTRSALRTVARQWTGDDWFAALKTGLIPSVSDEDIDELETEALARGWSGKAWHAPLRISDPRRSADESQHLQAKEKKLEALRKLIVPPFERLELAFGSTKHRPTGVQLAAALREFWTTLKIEEQLEDWAAAEVSDSSLRLPNSVHATVWEQMNAWLENVELAFPIEPLSLREWLPILEAGLGSLSVGVIPPALDQVLIGAIDRSRNPDIKLAIVLGLNETVFPAPPPATVLLTDQDQAELEKRNLVFASNTRAHLGRERYYAYIACTRARQRLVLTSAEQSADGSTLNPSPFLAQVRELFPTLTPETLPATIDWRESEHPSEIVGTLLRNLGPDAGTAPGQPMAELARLPALASVIDRLRLFRNPDLSESLAPGLAARLYGPVLRTSVSRMENFAACPFKYFVHSGLRAEERKLFELDVREQGSFQHDALALFHKQLRDEDKHWRDITPAQARERINQIAQALVVSYRDGLLQTTEQSRFMSRVLTESLQDFAEILVGWMGGQYQFDPLQVELPFGDDDQSPAWPIVLGEDRRLELKGRIDRVDIRRGTGSDEAMCVVVDYKSGQNKLDPVLMANGLQLQLLTYLNVLRRWPNPRELFGADRLLPAGVFYVSLRGKYDSEPNRNTALAQPEEARKLAYRHTGRFNLEALPYLDSRPAQAQGDQFNYRRAQSGHLYKSCPEPVSAEDFHALLDSVEENLQAMGEAIFSGEAKVSPFRKGALTACAYCNYRAVCRIDPWTHEFRVLKKAARE